MACVRRTAGAPPLPPALQLPLPLLLPLPQLLPPQLLPSQGKDDAGTDNLHLPAFPSSCRPGVPGGGLHRTGGGRALLGR